jgi:hypothetical protein
MRLTRILLFFLTCLPASFLWGQSEIGGASLNGTVTDPSGAVIAGSKVTVRSPATGFVRTVETTGAGLYSFSHLPVNTYDVTVEAGGFKTLARKDVALTVGASVTLDVQLTIGSTSETVNIDADVPVVETTRSSSSTAVSQKAVADLPVNGRNFIDFTALTPGVVKDPARSGDLSFAGQRGPANSLLVDGADSNNLFYAQATGRTGFRPYAFSQDAVQEFQVNANSFPAEVGRAGGGAINVITKSGTNQYHGSAFEFYRDKGMNANTFINNSKGAPKNPYHFNQFGGSFGGPIVKDKLFFFANYDGQRNTSSQVLAPATLPTAAQMPSFAKYLAPYQLGLNNKVGLIKVDWNATERDRLSVRYNLSRYTGVNQENAGLSSAQEHTGNNEVNTDNVAAVYTRTLGASTVWETRFNYVADAEPGYANTKGPEVAILNGITFGQNNFSPRYTNTKAYQPTSNVTLVKGRHTFKTGFDFNFARADNYFPGNFAGSYTFPSYAAFLANTPSKFVQGFSGTGTTAPTSHPDVNEWAAFAQDAWRVNDRLTLNLGIRYDYFAYRQPTTLNSNAQLTAAGLLTNKIATDPANFGPRAGFAYRLTKDDRVVLRGGYGIYFERTAGLLLSTAILQNGVDVLTYTLTSGLPTYPNILTTAPGASAPPDIYVMDPNFKSPRTQQFSLQTEIKVSNASSITIGYLGVNGTHLTRTRDINLFPELPVTGYLCASPAGCTPQTGTALSYYRHAGAGSIVRPNSAFGRISIFDSGANSIYHGGFVQYSHRFATNFQVLTSYTYSKVIDTRPDNTSVVSGNGGDDAKVAQDTLLPNNDRGPGDGDLRHKFVFSGVWDLNYAKSLKNPVARAVLNNWQISLITQAQSGRPYNALVSGDPNGDANNGNDRVPGVGRNTLRGPWYVAPDVRLSREIPLFRESVRLRLLGEAFNFVNRSNFSNIQNTQYKFSGGTFTPLSNFLARNASFDPRILQLAAKITF